MPDYSKACIYKIKHNEDYEDENIYIGSTCNLIRRRCQHKDTRINEKNKSYNVNLYKYIRENGGWDAFIMIKIHDYKCNSKSELKVEERRMIDMLKPKLNRSIPTRTRNELCELNKVVLAEKKKKYRKVNKEVLAEKKKEYYEANKEKHAERMKEYREANKEVIAERMKEYHKVNKEVIREKQKQKCKCDICGAEFSKSHLPRHKKTNKCLSAKK